jgi:ornithine decarboxylase
MVWENVPTDNLASNPAYWTFEPGAAWHGFRHIAPDYALTDPCKLTLLTPGFDRATGDYAELGVPAPVVAQYLRENRIVAEKNDLNSLLFLLTPGVESSKAGSLISALVAFKTYYDRNAPLDEVIPEFVARRPQIYSGLRLRDLCARMHDFYRAAGTSTLQREQFRPEHLPHQAMRPQQAVQKLTRNEVHYLPIDQVEGKIATTLWVVYPPGIATIAPGEIIDERAKPMLDYLKTFERGANLFPGFEAEIQGLYREKDADGSIRFYTYVADPE